MIKAQQIAPGQLAAVPATTVTGTAMEDITTMITAIMPLIMLILMMQLLKPMIGGMAEAAKS